MMNDQSLPLKRMSRLGQILKLFTETDKLSSHNLGKTFNTTKRTIQRDLSFLKEAGFPLQDIGQGFYRLDKNLFKHFDLFDDAELALIVAIKNMVSQLGQPFQRAADDIFSRLYHSSASLPLFIKIDESVALDHRLLNRILKAIREKKQALFQYETHVALAVKMEPYRIVHFGGFWYLVGKEIKAGILKRYALDKIMNFKLAKACFKCVPDGLDDSLESSANIWFSENKNIAVKVVVDQCCADYFKRRRIFPTQEIQEERPDGSLLIVFRVGRYEEIEYILKSWLPNVSILGPEEFRKKFLNDLKKCTKKHEKGLKE
jgi:predicted DNA-binding transcriptional regulator YafY